MSKGTQKQFKRWHYAVLTLLGYFMSVSAAHAAATLDEISFNASAGNQVEIVLHMSGDVPEPGSFTIDNPARIALDLPGTTNNLAQRKLDIGVGVARSVNAIEAGGRTRVVINLTRLTSYNTERQGNNIIIKIGGSGGGSAPAPAAKPGQPAAANSIQDVQFRRGEAGEGRVVVILSDPNTPMDVSRRGDQVILTIQNVQLPSNLERRLDVMDFGTSVRTVDAFKHGKDVRVVMTGSGQFEHITYQTDDKITVDVKKYVKPKEEIAQQKKKEYTGERISLSFVNIEVRAVLQLIADFTGINMVTSDAVQGTVTLRLKNVPWDQALDIILQSKGLDKRTKGNVMLIAPATDLAAQEKLELEAQKQIIELAPIVSRTIQVNYAKASEIVAILKSKGNSLLSERGNITVDQRTNKILVQDTAENIDAIVTLVEELDVPVRQVLVESRIVLVTSNFSKDLGIKFGVSGEFSDGSTQGAYSGSLTEADDFNQNSNTPGLNNRLNVNLPADGAVGSIGLAVTRIPFGTLLDLELSAAEAEGMTEIVSSPRVITSNQHKATILQGQEIPYLEASSSGSATIAFKEAVLKLEVTPQITPDDRINLDLLVTKDSPDFGRAITISVGGITQEGAPPINKQEVSTRILVDNGETIVLGGVYERTTTDRVTRVPFFGDLPIIGFLFRSTSESDDKSELLIFVTPKIVKQDINI